ncbi:MAG: AcrR family transcriptional regulator [Limisphaerales bacterium]
MSLRQQNKQRSRARIIEAATTLIAEQGVEDTTTREIAALAGVSYQTLYNYFPTKALLVRELLSEEFASLGRAADQIIKRYEGDVVGSLITVCETAADMMLGPKADVWAVLTREALNQTLDQEQLATLTTIGHEHFYALLKLADGTGHLAAGTDLHLLAHTLISLTDYNLLMLHVTGIDKTQSMTTLRQQFEMVVNPYLTTPHRFA